MTAGAETPYSYDANSNITLAEVIEAATRRTEMEIRVFFPATVTAVTDNGARVKVTPDIRNVLATDDGEQIVESVEIFDVPVWSDGQGAVGGGYIQFPVRVGDKGWVHVNDRSIDGWYENGIPDQPAGYGAHSMIDGVFKNGARDKTRAVSQDPTGAAVFEADSIKIGAAAALAAARKLDTVDGTLSMNAWITAVIAAFAALPIPIVVPPPVDFGFISGGSDKVKIE